MSRPWRVNPGLPDRVLVVLSETATAIAGRRPFKGDRVSLAKMPDRSDSVCCTRAIE